MAEGVGDLGFEPGRGGHPEEFIRREAGGEKFGDEVRSGVAWSAGEDPGSGVLDWCAGLDGWLRRSLRFFLCWPVMISR